MKFYTKPTCTTCRKTKAFLEANGIATESVDLNKGLSEEELDRLIGKRDHIPFLNTRNELYRERKMKQNPPSREEALRLMAKNPNLIKRPMLVKGRQIVLGFDPDGIRKLAALPGAGE